MSVCTDKRFVHDSGNFCPISLKFGTWIRYVITKSKFDGQVLRVNAPFIPQNRFLERTWGEVGEPPVQLKPIESTSAYFFDGR